MNQARRTTIKVSHTLRPATLSRIQEVADKEGRSRSGMIARLLTEALDMRDGHDNSPGRPVAPPSRNPSNPT